MLRSCGPGEAWPNSRIDRDVLSRRDGLVEPFLRGLYRDFAPVLIPRLCAVGRLDRSIGSP
jgi:hypothetical protein